MSDQSDHSNNYSNMYMHAAVLQALISSGELAGSLRGRMDKAVYIPNVYTQMQNAWADSFLASSAYLGIHTCICVCLYLMIHSSCLVKISS